jgi:hypothetical protein
MSRTTWFTSTISLFSLKLTPLEGAGQETHRNVYGMTKREEGPYL